MQQDGKTTKTLIAKDFDALAAEFAALRDDMAKLTHSVTATAEQRGRRMAANISDGMSEAVSYVERKGSGAEAEMEKAVGAHPYMALGLAALTGLLIGALTRR